MTKLQLRGIVSVQFLAVAVLASALMASPAKAAEETGCSNMPEGGKRGDTCVDKVDWCEGATDHYCARTQLGTCFTGECT